MSSRKSSAEESILDSMSSVVLSSHRRVRVQTWKSLRRSKFGVHCFRSSQGQHDSASWERELQISSHTAVWSIPTDRVRSKLGSTMFQCIKSGFSHATSRMLAQGRFCRGERHTTWMTRDQSSFLLRSISPQGTVVGLENLGFMAFFAYRRLRYVDVARSGCSDFTVGLILSNGEGEIVQISATRL